MKYSAVFILIILVSSVVSAAADSSTVLADTAVATVDSAVVTDSAAGDSGAVSGGMDTVRYNGDCIVYDVSNKVLNLNGNAQLHFEGTSLTADTIRYNTDTGILEAIGGPLLDDGDDKLYSEWMAYNVRTKWGKARYGTTRMDKGVYNGRDIRKSEDDILLVRDGDYCPCKEEDSVQTYFYGKKMKIITKDKVVSRPVIMNIADVPVFSIPYFVFPVKTGRRSGMLMPRWGGSEYGNGGKGTRYLDQLGYYFAINDYTDLTLRSKVLEFRDAQFHANARYKLRYWLDGNLGGSFYMTDNLYSMQEKWNINYSHQQKLLPDGTFTLNGRGQLMGDKDYHEDYSDSLQEKINKKMTANMTLSKSWPEKKVSANLGVSQNRDLVTDHITEELPSANFNFTERLLFQPPEAPPPVPDDSVVLDEDDYIKWYHSIYYGFRSNGLQRRTKDSSGTVTRHKGATHNFSIKTPQKLMRWVLVTPNFHYNENWFDSRYDSTTGRKDWGFFRRSDWNTGVSASTRLYGIFPVPIARFMGIRHTLSPTLSYSYGPEKKDGYMFKHVGIGDAGDRDKQRLVSYSANNLFQGKLRGDPDKNIPEKKPNLLNVGLSSGYNFGAKERKMSNLSINASTNIISKLSLNYSAICSFYDPSGNWVRPWDTQHSFRTSTGFNLSGLWWNGSIDLKPDLSGGSTPLAGDVSSRMGNWSMGVNHSYNYTLNKTYEGRPSLSKNYSLGMNSSLQFTRTWKAAYSSRYDFNDNQLANQHINFSKDLGCWNLIFQWTPTGPTKGYYFKVDMKQISDIKIEKKKP